MFVVFDLDGTLALNEHRQHYVKRPEGEKKDWDTFFELCWKDVPNLRVMRVLDALERAGHRIEIWSGRTDKVIHHTCRWLTAYNLDHIPFKCRADGDRTPDVDLKQKWFNEAKEKPELVFDDRDSVVAMWRRNGVACMQVAPGDF